MNRKLFRLSFRWLAAALACSPRVSMSFENEEDRIQVGGQAAAARSAAGSDGADAGRTLCGAGHQSQGHRHLLQLFDAERSGQARTTTAQDVLPQVDKVRIERAGTPALAGRSQESPDKLWPAVKDFWQELGFIINLEMPDAGIMETDWAENRAKIPQDIIRNTLGKVLDQHVFDRGARQVPHPPRSRCRSRARPRSTSAIAACRRCITTEGKDSTRVAAARAGPGTGSGNAAPPDGAARYRGEACRDPGGRRTEGAAGEAAARCRRRRHAATAGGVSTARGGASGWRSTASASRSRIATAPRACTTCATSIPRRTPRSSKKDEGWLSKLAFWRSNDTAKTPIKAQYRIHVEG